MAPKADQKPVAQKKGPGGKTASKEAGGEAKTRGRKKGSKAKKGVETYKIYIFKVLKQWSLTLLMYLQVVVGVVVCAPTLRWLVGCGE
uniref:Histone H2B.2 n=1 Tax=Aegilops tauschii TaxID=37682 RepID=M8AV00_AEGTA